MKKKFYLVGMLAAGLTFAGCTDDIDDASGSGGNTTVGDGYVKVAINLPTTSGNSTRSQNDQFDDGLEAEYHVNDVVLALFYGANEGSATCKWATDLTTSWSLVGTTDDNITTKSEFVVNEVPKPGENESVYAFVIVNNSGYFGVSDNKLTYDAEGSSLTNFEGTLSRLFTIASTVDLTKIASTTSNEGKGNFMMTNAPISDKASVQSSQTLGWDPTISTLVKVNVYDDEPTAEDATPTPIYVERVAAKVQVTVEGEDNTLNVSGDTYNGATVTFDNWTLQNTNKKTYLVRNVGTGDDAAWKTWIGYFSEVTGATDKENRFVGTKPGPYRTYWGIDPNYTTVAKTNLGDNFNIISQGASTDGWLVPTGSLSQSIRVAYCAENTTEAQAMAHNQLTGILLKATFKPSGAVEGSNFFTCNDISTIYTEENMIDAIEYVLATGSDEIKLGEGEEIQIKDGAEAATINDSNGLKGVFEVKTSNSPKDLADGQVSAILNKYKTIKFYKGGVTYYYTSLIKHFGDYYTPVAGGIEVLGSYSESNHLGRYGVVRNNWYELNIKSVSGPGEPEIPEIPEEPADKEHSYINTEINILSWAKREQNVDL